MRIAEDSALESLVNNAGFGGYMPFVELDPDRAEELICLDAGAQNAKAGGTNYG